MAAARIARDRKMHHTWCISTRESVVVVCPFLAVALELWALIAAAVAVVAGSVAVVGRWYIFVSIYVALEYF